MRDEDQRLASARATLHEHGRQVAFDRGDVLMAMGAHSDEVLLIESGIVKVLLPSDVGVDVFVGLHGAGSLVGDIGVLAAQPRSATIIGVRAGTATHVAAPVYRTLIGREATVRALADNAARERLRRADRKHLAVASRNVQERILQQLSDWANLCGETVADGIAVRGLTHRDLAGAVLASEKHVDAELRTLRAAGLVRTERMCFVLTGRAARTPEG